MWKLFKTFKNLLSEFIAELWNTSSIKRNKIRAGEKYLRKIYEAHVISLSRLLEFRVSATPISIGVTRARAFLFPWFTTVMRDGRFLAPAIIPHARSHWRYRRDTCCRYDRTTAFVFRWIRIVRSLINCLSLCLNRRISHARHRRDNRCFRKSCLTDCSYDYRMYLTRFEMVLNEGRQLYLVIHYGYRI